MAKWRTRLYKTDRARDFEHERDRQVRARQVYETIDRQNFQWTVTLVAGIGFFLDGYTIFASNIVLPMVAYVYWQGEVAHEKLTWINTATLAGTLIGQLVFGVLADMRGRKKMYGVELIMLIVSTLGVVMSSSGEHNSMSVLAWLMVWRFVSGIAVGADYPVSAVITAEFAPTVQRARMMAAIFFMQPLGQAACNIVSIIVITITRRSIGASDLTRAVDIMWRWIVGIGIFPAVLGIVFRLAIPETPRFMLEIEDDPVKAEFDATYLFGDAVGDDDVGSSVDKELESGNLFIDTSAFAIPRPATSTSSNVSTSRTYYAEDDFSPVSGHEPADWTLTTQPLPTLNSTWSQTRADVYQYFIKEGNYITLLATSLAWLLLDFGFYGIGLSSPHFLAKTWGSLNIHGRRPPWQITDDPNVSVYDQFLDTSNHAFVILNLGGLAGGLLLIIFINRLNRVWLQRWGFIILAALFVHMGVSIIKDPTQRGPGAVSLYIIAQLFFNFGPNATTFMLPAELFPTRYRATCHGISAAMGKAGSLMMQAIGLAAAKHGRHAASADGGHYSAEERAMRYAKLLFGFSIAMLLGFFVSLLIPHVQEKVERKSRVRDDGEEVGVLKQMWYKTVDVVVGFFTKGLRSKTLEELSLGRKGQKSASFNRSMRNRC